MEIAVLVDDLGRSLRVLVVALHHVEALTAHLALHANRTLLARLWVEHLDIDEGEVATYGGAMLLESIVETGLELLGSEMVIVSGPFF